jgi:hypothetical protein
MQYLNTILGFQIFKSLALCFPKGACRFSFERESSSSQDRSMSFNVHIENSGSKNYESNFHFKQARL